MSVDFDSLKPALRRSLIELTPPQVEALARAAFERWQSETDGAQWEQLFGEIRAQFITATRGLLLGGAVASPFDRALAAVIAEARAEEAESKGEDADKETQKQAEALANAPAVDTAAASADDGESIAPASIAEPAD